MRGYAVIALDKVKSPINVGAALRAAHVYGASLVIVAGKRFQKASTDVTKAWRHLPIVEVADVFDALPYDCVPVAVDLVPKARPLPGYTHPQRACYIFAVLWRKRHDRCKSPRTGVALMSGTGRGQTTQCGIPGSGSGTIIRGLRTLSKCSVCRGLLP